MGGMSGKLGGTSSKEGDLRLAIINGDWRIQRIKSSSISYQFSRTSYSTPLVVGVWCRKLRSEDQESHAAFPTGLVPEPEPIREPGRAFPLKKNHGPVTRSWF